MIGRLCPWEDVEAELKELSKSLHAFKRAVRQNPHLRPSIAATWEPLAISAFYPALKAHK